MREILEQFTIWSALDITVISILVYQALMLLRGTKSAQMLIGIGLIIVIATIMRLLPLTTLHWLISKLYPSFLLIVIIIFQDDIRRLLSSMGRTSLASSGGSVATQQLIDEISRAASSLASKRIGALMVIEREIILSRYIDFGIQVDSKVSKELLVSIFHPSSPIHDGAAVFQRSRLSAAGCFLPLTKDESVDPNMGTRHRAAIGISEETDAVVVLVSEEGASMSLVTDGQVKRVADAKSLRNQLIALLSPPKPESPSNAEKKPQIGFFAGISGVTAFFKKRSDKRISS
jgi:diadenylate cyclase